MNLNIINKNIKNNYLVLEIDVNDLVVGVIESKDLEVEKNYILKYNNFTQSFYFNNNINNNIKNINLLYKFYEEGEFYLLYYILFNIIKDNDLKVEEELYKSLENYLN